jgi:hypothetical protein
MSGSSVSQSKVAKFILINGKSLSSFPTASPRSATAFSVSSVSRLLPPHQSSIDTNTNTNNRQFVLIVHEDPALRETLKKPVMGNLVFIKEEVLL